MPSRGVVAVLLQTMLVPVVLRQTLLVRFSRLRSRNHKRHNSSSSNNRSDKHMHAYLPNIETKSYFQ